MGSILECNDVADLKKLSKDADWRAEMVQKFGEIKDKLDPLVEELAERQITLED